MLQERKERPRRQLSRRRSFNEGWKEKDDRGWTFASRRCSQRRSQRAWFYLLRYVEAYKASVAMLPSKESWKKVELGYPVGPPHTKRPRGRPKTKRIRGVNEKSKKSKQQHRCARCGGWGHHKSTCKNPINPAVTKSSTSESKRGRRKKATDTERNSTIGEGASQAHETMEEQVGMDNWDSSQFHISPIKPIARTTPMKTKEAGRSKTKPLRVGVRVTLEGW